MDAVAVVVVEITLQNATEMVFPEDDDVVEALAAPFGRQLKRWRRQRALSQLEFVVRADVSQRHISFIESGRSRPKAEVVQKIADALEIPIRERNHLLESAGLAPNYPEVSLSSEKLAPFRNAIEQMLRTHKPYPAYVINRSWELVDANTAGRLLFPWSGEAPVNLLDAFLEPGPFRERIHNFPTVARNVLHRIRSEAANVGHNNRLHELVERAESVVKDLPPSHEEIGSDLVLCPHLEIGGQVIKTIVVVARFGSAREVTLDELRVELVFPGDANAEAFFRGAA